MHLRFGLVLLFPLFTYAQAPDLADVERRSSEAHKKNDPLAELYAYRERIVFTGLDKNGKQKDVRTETWDVIGLEGSSYRKLIQRDDKPLSAKEQKSEDKRLANETEKRRKENAERKNGGFSRTYTLRFGPDSGHLFDISYAGEESIHGRPTHVLVGIPKESVQPANDNEKELLYYRMKRWIDKEDLIDAKVELEVIKPGSRMQIGSVFGTTFRRLDDGVWVAVEISNDYDVRFFKIAGDRGTQIHTRSDFHKFEVSSRVIDAPQ